MKAEHVFLSAGRVRPIWRFFLAALLIALAHVAVGIVLGVAFGLLGGPPRHILFWVSALLFLALMGLFKFLTAVLDQKPLSSMGLGFCGRWKQELALGVFLGATMISAVVSLEWLLGLATFAPNPIAPRWLLAGGAYYVALFMLAAVAEEITFRGYAFQRLVEAIGPVGAVAILSAAFGLVHLSNPSHSWLSTANTILIGIPLAVAYLRTRALWLPLGIHFAWNFVLVYGFGLPVSGISFSKSLLIAEVHGFVQLTGGNYGPEGSWLATVVILAATIYLLLSRRIFISKEMRALVLDPPSAPPENPAPGAHFTAATLDSAKASISGII